MCCCRYESIRAMFREDAKLHPQGARQKSHASRTHKMSKAEKTGR